jgi:hypothetical protein
MRALGVKWLQIKSLELTAQEYTTKTKLQTAALLNVMKGIE